MSKVSNASHIQFEFVFFGSDFRRNFTSVFITSPDLWSSKVRGRQKIDIQSMRTPKAIAAEGCSFLVGRLCAQISLKRSADACRWFPLLGSPHFRTAYLNGASTFVKRLTTFHSITFHSIILFPALSRKTWPYHPTVRIFGPSISEF